jgi:plastocyanin
MFNKIRNFDMKVLISVLFILVFAVSNVILAGNIKGTVKSNKAKVMKNAVIYIDKIEGKRFDPPTESLLMDQKNLTFVPHVLPIIQGTTIDFQNSDDVLHNVFSPDKCVNKFNLGSWPKGEKRSFTFEEPGCTAVMLCNVHPEMEAYIITLETPYFGKSDDNGNFEISNVPAGKYTLKIWHERLQGEDKEITVSEKGDVKVEFQLER